MAEIEKKFAKLVNENPEKEFKIIMVFESGYDVNKFNLKKINLLMDSILSTTLTGKEIIEISKNNAISSIEPDSEMEIL